MKTTTASRDPQAFEKLQELVREIDIAMLTTVTADGVLRSRPMVTLDFSDDGEIWFFTSDEAGKVHDLDLEHAVNLSYADPKRHRFVSVSGNATIVREPERAEEFWRGEVKKYFPRGLDDPHLALLCVRVETAEFWDSPAAKAVSLLRGKHSAPHDEQDASDNGAEHTKVDIRATPSSG